MTEPSIIIECSGDLNPHQTVLPFGRTSIYRVGGGPAAPSSTLPIGYASSRDPLRLVKVVPSSEMVHSILFVTYATTEDQALDSTIAGYLYVYVTLLYMHNLRHNTDMVCVCLFVCSLQTHHVFAFALTFASIVLKSTLSSKSSRFLHRVLDRHQATSC